MRLYPTTDTILLQHIYVFQACMLESIASIGISIPVTDEDVQDTQPTVGWWYKGMSTSYSAWDILTRLLRMIAVVVWVFSARVRWAGLGSGGGAVLYKHCVHTLCFTSTVHCVLNTMLAKGMPLPIYS